MFMLKPLLTFVLIGITILSAGAQTYHLTGQVTDEKNEPVPFASIYPKDAAHAGTSANSEGVFKLNLPAGRHELVIRSVGYRQAIEPVTLEQDKHIQVTLLAESYLLEDRKSVV